MLQVALIKIAALGDVALACRALADFALAYEVRNLEIHWLIDKSYEELARSLLARLMPGQLIWHSISAERLFRGNRLQKLGEALKIRSAIATSRPVASVLLHRDFRYRLLLQSTHAGSVITIPRVRRPELETYSKAFDSLASRLDLKRRASSGLAVSSAPVSNAVPPSPLAPVGLLVGGARNAKTDFAEKRWPAMTDFVMQFLKYDSRKLILFGGPEDQPIAEALMAKLRGAGDSYAGTSRIQNLVGQRKLAELPNDLAQLSAFISIDSGLAHIAASVMSKPGQQVITLFGPTDPGVWGPTANGNGRVQVIWKRPSCSPCYQDDGAFRPCIYSGVLFQQCMTSITPSEVVALLTPPAPKQ